MVTRDPNAMTIGAALRREAARLNLTIANSSFASDAFGTDLVIEVEGAYMDLAALKAMFYLDILDGRL